MRHFIFSSPRQSCCLKAWLLLSWKLDAQTPGRAGRRAGCHPDAGTQDSVPEAPGSAGGLRLPDPLLCSLPGLWFPCPGRG